MKETNTIDQALTGNPLIKKEDTPENNRQAVIPSVRYTMPLHTRRSHPRIYRQAYIRYAGYRSGHFHEAVMYNESGGGMYFETRNRLTPGTKIYIAFGDQPGRDKIRSEDFFTAEVRWCIAVNHSADVRYGIGVRYLQPMPH